MAEQTTAQATRPAPGSKAPGKKYAGLTRNQWFIVGGVFVAALGYILWKRHQASSSASQQAATNQGSNECTDANGNPVDCNELFASELAALQNSLDQLGAASGGSGGSGATGTVGTSPGTTDGTGATSTTQPSTTPTSSTGTKTATKTAGAITGLKATNVTKTAFTASWNKASNDSGGYQYTVRDLATHTYVGPSAGTKTNSTSVTVSGLKSGVDYNFGVQALPGGTGNNIHVRTK